jgi:hypothetical protein
MARLALLGLLLCLLSTACMTPFSGAGHGEPGHLSAVEMPEESPARAAPVTDTEIDRVPELERVLERAVTDPNGSASLTVEPDRVDHVGTVLAGKPSFGPDAPRFHRDGVYLRTANGTAPVRTSTVTGKIYAEPAEVAARDVPVNDLGARGGENASRLAALAEEAVAHGDVVSRSLNGRDGGAAAAALDGFEPYRLSYNDRRYWGSVIAYRDSRFAVSVWQNDTAS